MVKIGNKKYVAFFARTFWQRLRGLIFRKRPINILFEFEKPTRWGAAIHSFGVFKSFTAVWADASGNVIDIKVVRPFSIAAPPKAAKWLLEIYPAEKLGAKGLKFAPIRPASSIKN